MLKKIIVATALTIFALGGALHAQQTPAPPIKRTILQKADIPGTNLEVVLAWRK
jgi:hypothetical protein